jgi:hypothetical protein
LKEQEKFFMISIHEKDLKKIINYLIQNYSCYWINQDKTISSITIDNNSKKIIGTK